MSCLFIANDCLLFCKANSEACNKLKSVLDYFCATSEKLINDHRSALTFSRNPLSVQKHVITAIFSIPRRESLGKYLGCPIFQGRPSNTIFQDFINRAMTQLECQLLIQGRFINVY